MRTDLCQPPGCGDGLLYRDEVCDDGNTDDTDACRKRLFRGTASCGDGVTRTDLNETQEGYEACDDANNDEEDGIASTCRIQGCGDGIRQSDEFCDDGDTRDDNACRADCQAAARCGDGVRRRIYRSAARAPRNAMTATGSITMPAPPIA